MSARAFAFASASRVQPTRALRLSLTVDNLFDKRYYASSYNELWVAPGAERQVTLAATYKF